MSYVNNEFFLIALTFTLYFLAKQLNKRTGWVLLNPILLTIAALIAFLKLTGVSYDTYNQGGHLIEFWLRPAVVALGVPLYLQLETIKKQFLPILISELAGCVTGIVSVVLIARSMGASRDVILSLAPKSVTTPIAMEVTRAVGGLPSLTAAVVVCVGLLAPCGLQDDARGPRTRQHGAGPVDGYGGPRRGYGHVDGRQPPARGLRQSGPDAQRHPHGPAHPHHPALMGF